MLKWNLDRLLKSMRPFYFQNFKDNGFVSWEISLQGILSFATKKSMSKCSKQLHNWL